MRILALDMDGTSLNREGLLEEETTRALAETVSRGWTVCFVTGRTKVDMLPLGDSWRTAQYLILNNGGKTIRASDDSVVRSVCVASEEAEILMRHCLANNLQLYVLGSDKWWLNIETPRDRSYIERIGCEPEKLVDLGQVPLNEVEAFMSLRDWETVGRWIADAGLNLEVLNSEPGCIDIMPSGVTKWSALSALAESLGATADDIVAMGNYHNDLDMIAAAGIGVAVPSAPAEVLKAADYVTTRDFDDGAVVEAVERFVFLAHG